MSSYINKTLAATLSLSIFCSSCVSIERKVVGNETGQSVSRERTRNLPPDLSYSVTEVNAPSPDLLALEITETRTPRQESKITYAEDQIIEVKKSCSPAYKPDCESIDWGETATMVGVGIISFGIGFYVFFTKRPDPVITKERKPTNEKSTRTETNEGQPVTAKLTGKTVKLSATGATSTLDGKSTGNGIYTWPVAAVFDLMTKQRTDKVQIFVENQRMEISLTNILQREIAKDSEQKLKAAKKRGATHVITLLLQCKQQLDDSYICQDAFICPIEDYIASKCEDMSTQTNAATRSNFVLNTKSKISFVQLGGGQWLAVKRGGTTVLVNGFGAEFAGAIWNTVAEYITP